MATMHTQEQPPLPTRTALKANERYTFCTHAACTYVASPSPSPHDATIAVA